VYDSTQLNKWQFFRKTAIWVVPQDYTLVPTTGQEFFILFKFKNVVNNKK